MKKSTDVTYDIHIRHPCVLMRYPGYDALYVKTMSGAYKSASLLSPVISVMQMGWELLWQWHVFVTLDKEVHMTDEYKPVYIWQFAAITEGGNHHFLLNISRFYLDRWKVFKCTIVILHFVYFAAACPLTLLCLAYFLLLSLLVHDQAIHILSFPKRRLAIILAIMAVYSPPGAYGAFC